MLLYTFCHERKQLFDAFTFDSTTKIQILSFAFSVLLTHQSAYAHPQDMTLKGEFISWTVFSQSCWKSKSLQKSVFGLQYLGTVLM